MPSEHSYQAAEAEARDHARRILLMVHELHRLGYERLRILPMMAPSGMHWRCKFFPAGEPHRELQFFSTGSGAACFTWEDATEDSPAELGRKFIARVPAASAAKGEDPAYAAWFVTMLKATAPLGLPIEMADWELKRGVVSTIGCDKPVELPLAPPFKR